MILGFIGCGHMGGALVRAAAPSGAEILVSEHHPEKIAALLQQGLIRSVGAEELVRASDFLFLGVKPQAFPSLFETLVPLLEKRERPPVLVSMAAGIRLDAILARVGETVPVLRILPNLAVAAGKGLILYTPSKAVTEEQERQFLSVLKAGGLFDRIREEQMDAGCAVSGCGPAFVYEFLRAVVAGGEACGLSREQASRYAIQMLKGAAEKIPCGEDALEEEIRAICSPGGSTVEGVKVLRASDLQEVVCRAVRASCERNRELGK